MGSLYPGSVRRSDEAVLERWGFADGGGVNRLALMDSLARLQVDERPMPPGAAGLIRRASRCRHDLMEVAADALALATACEAEYAADERWPQGLSDRLADLLDWLEQHQHREEAVVFPLFLSRSPEAPATAVLMTDEHHSIRRQFDALSAITDAFRAPFDAGVKWRILYLLCRKIEFEVRARMAMEDRELFAPEVRDSTEVDICPAATST